MIVVGGVGDIGKIGKVGIDFSFVGRSKPFDDFISSLLLFLAELIQIVCVMAHNLFNKLINNRT
jgi:hypothetical protein